MIGTLTKSLQGRLVRQRGELPKSSVFTVPREALLRVQYSQFGVAIETRNGVRKRIRL